LLSNNSKQPWQTEETLKLLDLIDRHGDNWEEILKQIGGSRTKEEIILHFLQLPLKNISSVHLFDNGESEEPSSKFAIEKMIDEEPSCFSDYSNPLLQHVAIFKSLLDKYNTRAAKREGVSGALHRQQQ
jgi:hypothetical protein